MGYPFSVQMLPQKHSTTSKVYILGSITTTTGASFLTALLFTNLAQKIGYGKKILWLSNNFKKY